MRIRNLVLLLIAAIGAVLALQAFWIEPDSLRVNDYDLPLMHWPVSQNGLRIALIGDLHAGAPFIDEAKIDRVVAMANASHPDLILLAGDYLMIGTLFGHYMPPDVIAAHLSHLHAPLGVFAVLGNNDDYDGHRASVLAAFKQNGIVTLENRVQRIRSGRYQFWLAGLSDYSTIGSDPLLVLKGVDDDAPVIALTHDPIVFYRVPPRINVLLAAHTHGGQVRFPLIGAPALRHSKYVRWHYREKTDMFITTGIGTSNLAVRFGVPPEISVLTLHQDR
ncbi:MAG: metallophosphoesterase [Stenotrophobium sp.]